MIPGLAHNSRNKMTTYDKKLAWETIKGFYLPEMEPTYVDVTGIWFKKAIRAGWSSIATRAETIGDAAVIELIGKVYNSMQIGRVKRLDDTV
jgi:hypothetical protein